MALYIGTGIQKPDYLATIDADPGSPTYSQVISRLEMPGIGDKLHHMGWNACSSCHHDATKERRYLIVPGVRSSNLHIVDCGADPRNPRLHKVIEGAEIKAKTNLSAPHTVHCLGPEIIISMLGDAKGEAPGGFLHLNEDFEIVGRWENDLGGMKFNYDFWYQPRHNDEPIRPRSTPTRLTVDEVLTIKTMVESPEYRHVSRGRLAILTQRLGRVFAAPATWYKLVRERGWRREKTIVEMSAAA